MAKKREHGQHGWAGEEDVLRTPKIPQVYNYNNYIQLQYITIIHNPVLGNVVFFFGGMPRDSQCEAHGTLRKW